MIQMHEVAMIYSDRYIRVSRETNCTVRHDRLYAALPGECYSGYPKQLTGGARGAMEISLSAPYAHEIINQYGLIAGRTVV